MVYERYSNTFLSAIQNKNAILSFFRHANHWLSGHFALINIFFVNIRAFTHWYLIIKTTPSIWWSSIPNASLPICLWGLLYKEKMSRKYVGFFGGPVGVTFFEGPASCMMAETLISFGMSQVLEWPVLGLTKRSIPWDKIHILNYIERPKSAGIGYFFEKSIASNLKII